MHINTRTLAAAAVIGIASVSFAGTAEAKPVSLAFRVPLATPVAVALRVRMASMARTGLA
jgi:hypothetical protein